jgi:hypothetical protein
LVRKAFHNIPPSLTTKAVKQRAFSVAVVGKKVDARICRKLCRLFRLHCAPTFWSNAMIRINLFIRVSGLIDRVRRSGPTRLLTLVEADRPSQKCSPVRAMGGAALPGVEASAARATFSLYLWIA